MIVYEKLSEGGGGGIDHEFLTRFTPVQQNIIDKDPILGQLASDPQKTAELQKIITHDPQVFQVVDNPEAKSNLLKGLGYGQYASNGQEFVKLAALSADEMGKLPFPIRMEVKKWKQEQLDQVVASKTAEINEQKEIIDRSLPAIETLVGSAKDAMTSSGQSIIEGKLIEERGNPSSPINKKLIESGVSIQDISSAKYDDMRRASIMIGIVNDKDEFAKFKASGAIKDETQFLGSINKIKELGVISSPVSLKNFSDHIDSRFPKTPETERAKEEISRSIESGSIASIHYDGKGEKYTLIDRDGKTSKDVYMNPPRVTIRQSTLFHSFEIYTDNDILQRETEKRDLNSLKQSNNDRTLALLEMIQKGDGSEEKKKALLKQKEQDESSFNKFTIGLGNLMKSNDRPTERADRAREMHIFLTGIRTTPVGLFDKEKSALIDLESGLRKEASLAKLSKIPEGAKAISENERIVKSNIDLLVSEGFADMGGDATRALAKIIEFENRTNKRTNSNMIFLERPIDKDTDLPRLKKYLEKLGITESSRRKAGLSDIQESISISLSKPPDDPNSIESKLADKPKPEPL